jgi:hypothetical protein
MTAKTSLVSMPVLKCNCRAQLSFGGHEGVPLSLHLICADIFLWLICVPVPVFVGVLLLRWHAQGASLF